jgi:hypothetical protein
MVDLGQGVGDDLTGARPSAYSGVRRLAGDGAMEREEHGESISGFTRAWAVVWRPSDGSKEMAEEVRGAGGAWASREEKRSGGGGGRRCDGGW